MNLDIDLQQNTSLAADFLERPGGQASANPGSPKACPALWTLGFMDPRVSQEHMLAMTSLPSVKAAQPRAPPLFLRKMDRSPDQGESPAPASDDRWRDSGEFRLQVDFFRKLGYSTKEVQAILLKLGPGADTNTVLGELVRSGAGTAAEREAATAESQGPSIVPRGGGSTKAPCIQSAALSTPQEGERDAVNVLKPIVIDGSNVAMSHGNKVVFSCLGLQLAVNYFLGRGHKDITVFVPSWRKEQPRPDVPITDQQILRDLERKKILVFTPSRRVGGKRVVCYDDRFIVKLAHETDGIIVSNDTYRDLQNERPEWKRCIEEQLLMYSFVNDKFMPPDDPLGRYGPSLDNFLRKKPQVAEQKRQPCPYEKKCTYGIKCKFFHPERANQSQRSLADELRENAKLSALKDDRRHTSPKKHSHSPASMSMEEELEQLSLDSQHCARKGQMSENMPFYWTGAYWTDSKMPSPSSQPERSSHQSPTSIDPSVHCGSQECLDSGLGSYESQYSEASWRPYGAKVRASPCSSRPSYPPHGDPDRLEGYRSCDCCSLQQYGHNPTNRFATSCQPCYPAYGDHPYPSAVQHYSLPRNFPHQDKYWVLPNHSSSSLPAELCQMPGLRARGSTETYADQWAQPQHAAFGGEREEVRKKLQAIFNPYHVEQVMEMFPHMLDPQKLAAEILSLKSQGRI